MAGFVSAIAKLFKKTLKYQAIALVRCLASTHVFPTRFLHLAWLAALRTV